MELKKHNKLRAAVIFAIAEHMVLQELDLEDGDGQPIPQEWVNEARHLKDEFYDNARREADGLGSPETFSKRKI